MEFQEVFGEDPFGKIASEQRFAKVEEIYAEIMAVGFQKRIARTKAKGGGMVKTEGQRT